MGSRLPVNAKHGEARLGLLSELLPNRRLSGRSRLVWTAVLVLSPLAWLAGLWLHQQIISGEHLYLSAPRAQAIHTARSYAEARGWEVGGWTAYASVETDSTTRVYYRSLPDEMAERLRRLRPETFIRVVFLPEAEGGVFEALLAPDGRPFGFTSELPETATARLGGFEITSRDSEEPEDEEQAEPEPQPEEGREEAFQLALARFEALAAGIEVVRFDPQPSVETDRTGRALVRVFTWKGRNEERPELTLRIRFRVQGGRLLAEEVLTDLDPLFVGRELEHQTAAKTVAWVLVVLVGLSMAVYAFVLYVRKSLQKEVSHARVLALGTAIALSFSLVILVSAGEMLGAQLKRPVTHPLFLLMIFMIVAVYLLLGLWVGMLWGSSEGEVRIAYPGKLVSLDALILGRVFTRNVARSSLAGAALGGWMSLAVALVEYPWIGVPHFGAAASSYTGLLYSRLPGIVSILSPLTASVPVVTIGLLVPMTFTLRVFRSPRVRRIVFFVLALISCGWIGLNIDPLPAGLMVTVLTVAALIVTFRTYDLLTSLATLSASSFATGMTAVYTVTSFGTGTLLAATTVVLVILSLHAYFVVYGREVREEEVRPLYAQNLAQRLSLQAEVSAAREAQLRLAPQGVPELNGFSLAACCEPGRVVGGDFYDFFPMEGDRVALFLAEGGGSGLSSALAIAYAKGVILPMLPRQPQPEEVVRRLRLFMRESIRSHQENIGFLFGILDGPRGIFRYARHGEFPRLVLAGAARPLREEAPASEDTAGEDADPRFVVGRVRLQPASRLVLVTNGVVDVLETSREDPEQWIVRQVAQHPSAPAPALQSLFLQALQPLIRQSRRLGVEDDISAIFLSVEKPQPREQVA